MRSVKSSADRPALRCLALVCTLAAWCTAAGIAPAAASTPGRSDAVESVRVATPARVQEGAISWYGARFHDAPTASGERFDAAALTMAHPSLPFGTRVRVTNLRNGRSVVLRVNDRGPFTGRRVADVSHAAAALLGMVRRGVALARLEVVEEPRRG